MRTVDELIASSLKTIHWGFCNSPDAVMAPLFSGGHDSMVACHIASQHERFTGDVHHIDTGIGARYTRGFVEDVCGKFGWNLIVHKSPATYREFVAKLGFPGPGSHQWVYNWIKDRCVGQIARGMPRLLITGCRQQESIRRMGHVERVKVGETSKKTGKRSKRNRIWTAACHDWSKAEQQLYMDEFGLPVNKLKVVIGMSGECFCGAYAQPGEIQLIEKHAPDVADEIGECTLIAKRNGTPCEWGTRPKKDRLTVSPTGPMCSSCDQRAAACGIVLIES